MRTSFILIRLTSQPTKTVSQYLDNVINNGTNYADAFFEIGYLKAFSSEPLLAATISGTSTGLVTATADASSPSGTAGSSTGNGTTTGTNGAGNGAFPNARTHVAVVAATMVSAFTWAML